MKKVRQKAILDLVRGREIASQEELLEGLQARNIDVSQSTLSRDIQELGLAKSGGVYTVIVTEPPRSSDETIRRTLREFLTEDAAVAQNIVVLKTGPGHASTVSRAIDEAATETFLERADMTRHRRGREAELAAGRRKAAVLHDAHEDPHRLHPVHG